MKNKSKFLVAKKVGMSQIIDDSGQVIPVTVVKAYENEIVGFRTLERDGYESVRVGYDSCLDKKLSKPAKGQFGSQSYRHIKEFRVNGLDGFELNSKVNVESLDSNQLYDVQSKTIGRGFTGAIKAWNHQRGPETHGSKSHRLIGSIGQATTPGKVNKGRDMHTRYGNETVTIKNLELVKLDGDYLFFKGAIPGKNNVVYITGH